MPTLTLGPGTMKELNLKADALNTSPLTAEALRALSALLVSRGFEVALPITVVPIDGGGFLLTQ